MPSIQKHGEKWRAQVFKNGVRKSAVFDQKRQAQEWGIRTEAELSLRDQLKAGGKTFGQAASLYQATVSVSKKGRGPTWEAARLGVMTEFFGAKTPLSKITSERIGQWRDKRLESVTGSTVQREANLLRNLLLTAKNEWKWINHHPFEGVKLPDAEPPRELVWGWREIRRVLRYCETGGPKTQEMGRAFHLALRTAMRLKEVLQARLVGQIAVLGDTKTTRKGQVVKVPLTRQGRRLLSMCPPFTIGENEASALFWQITVACGIREPEQDGLTFHDSRATALTLMARKMDVMTLARISRHRDIRMLMQRYYRETPEQIAARL
jgi:integrase